MNLRNLGPFSVPKPSFRKAWAVSQLSALQTRTTRSQTLTFSPLSSGSQTLASATPHWPPHLHLEGSGFAFISVLSDDCSRRVWERGVEVLPPDLRRGGGTEVPKGRTPRSQPLRRMFLHGCILA